MKHFFLLLFLVCFFSGLKAQTSETFVPASGEIYLTRSKHQRTAAWVLSGAGLVGMVAGAGTAMQHMSFSISFYGSPAAPEPKQNSGEGLFIAGAIVFAAGIGFAVASAVNKHKANKALTTLLKVENASFVSTQAKREVAYPAVAFRLRL